MVQGDEVGPLGAGLCIHMALGQADRIIIIKVKRNGADRDRAVSAPEHHLGIYTCRAYSRLKALTAVS